MGTPPLVQHHITFNLNILIVQSKHCDCSCFSSTFLLTESNLHIMIRFGLSSSSSQEYLQYFIQGLMRTSWHSLSCMSTNDSLDIRNKKSNSKWVKQNRNILYLKHGYIFTQSPLLLLDGCFECKHSLSCWIYLKVDRKKSVEILSMWTQHQSMVYFF